MTYSFHPEARTEFKEATLYYLEKSPSLASAFYAEVRSAVEGIIKNPFLYRAIHYTKTSGVVSQNAFHTLFSSQLKIISS